MKFKWLEINDFIKELEEGKEDRAEEKKNDASYPEREINGKFAGLEHQRVDAFELWCWRRLLKVARTARRSNQSILEEISPE